MTFDIHDFGASVVVRAEANGLTIRGLNKLSARENWPADAIQSPGAWRTAVEIEQLLELGLAEENADGIAIPYENFESIANDLPVSVTGAWTAHSPFLLKIDRKSDIGRPDFQYRYTFILAGREIHVDRLGYYIRRAGYAEIFLLDSQMYSLVEAMDAFNALPAEIKTPQQSWLTFAKIKGCAAGVGAMLDSTLEKNDVVIPSQLGLDMREDADGGLTFLPKCAELATEEFHQVFERNPGAEKLYTLDRPGLGRVRIVLTDAQHAVLKRMKRVRGIRGELKDRLRRDPVQVFDGIADDVDLPYGDRVIGIGEFPFAPMPHPQFGESEMGKLWDGQDGKSEIPPESPDGGGIEGIPQNAQPASSDGNQAASAGGTTTGAETARTDNMDPNAGPRQQDLSSPDQAEPAPSRNKYLLIETDEETVQPAFRSEAETAKRIVKAAAYEKPLALRPDRDLHPHQVRGVQWLQTCAQVSGRKGVLLADDMGVGKTIQVLTFLAWCIESGRFPELARPEPPFRPILIVAPLILLDTRTWEREMENFFINDGVVFWPVLTLHGGQLEQFRRRDTEGPEVVIGRPVLDLDRIQRHKVVITNYETVKNYQHSFAYLKNGKPVWSVVITDEAQEFKIPNTKLSHAMKAIESDLHIACTGTPVENRLLDLWNLCDVFQRGLLGSAREFVHRFEKPRAAEEQQQSMTELKKMLLFQQEHAFLLRRTKDEVASLPPKHIVKLDCVMSKSEIADHEELLRELNMSTGRNRFLSTLQRFALLYQHKALLKDGAEDRSAKELISESSKIQTLLSTLHDIRGRREKVIIFARHRVMQAILAKVIQEEFGLPVRIINGETKLRAGGLRASGVKTRNAILTEFRERLGFGVLILSPFVAGIGLTIVEANHVIHYGRWWNPAVEAQATDRAYRIGQTKDVWVYLPILRDPSGQLASTFDQRLDNLMERKQRIAEDFLRPLPPEEEMGSELISDLRAEAVAEGGDVESVRQSVNRLKIVSLNAKENG